jgi:ParB/RepB/Spo0J family partition protein
MLRTIPLERILPNPEQPRKTFNPGDLRSLAESIRIHGILQPVQVEAAGDSYILHDGERRVRAARMARLKEIPALILDGSGMDQQARLERALVANLQRVDLDPIEEANAFQRLINEFGLTHNQVAKRVGKLPIHISHRLLLLKLDEPIQQLISDGEFSPNPSLARELLRIPSSEARIDLADGLFKSKVTIAEARYIIKQKAKEMAAAEQLSMGFSVETRGKHATPVIRYAAERSGDSGSLDWRTLHSCGMGPTWPAVLEAAERTCDACNLRPYASKVVCQDCSAIDFFSSLVQLVETGDVGRRVYHRSMAVQYQGES